MCLCMKFEEIFYSEMRYHKYKMGREDMKEDRHEQHYISQPYTWRGIKLIQRDLLVSNIIKFHFT